jgi:hypothetical protein
MIACTASGCATLAKKPPTPADDISPREAAAITAPPDERFYVIVFGSQSTPKRAKYTHSWAAVVKVTGDKPETRKIEEHTISWMPASLVIRPASLKVEPGTNLPLDFTIQEMRRNGEHIALWGPYEVRPGFFHRFLVQKAFMESGQVGYQCIDSVGEAARHGSGCDCIHAITDMDPLFDRNRYPLTYFGQSASLNIVRQIHTRPVIVGPEADHGWLLSALGLDQDCIERRHYFGCTVPYTPENLERYLSRHDGH